MCRRAVMSYERCLRAIYLLFRRYYLPRNKYPLYNISPKSFPFYGTFISIHIDLVAFYGKHSISCSSDQTKHGTNRVTAIQPKEREALRDRRVCVHSDCGLSSKERMKSPPQHAKVHLSQLLPSLV